MTFFRVFLVILIQISLFGSPEHVDLFLKNHLNNEAIVETKEIKIPGYPKAFNPSIVPCKGGYLLSFRYAARFPSSFDGCRSDASFIGLAKLNKKWEVSEKSVQVLNIQSYDSSYTLTAEDGRLFEYQNRIFLFFNDLRPQNLSGFALYFAEVIEEDGNFKLKGPAKYLRYPLANRVEKNWSPFVYDDKIHLIYSDNPRLILRLDTETGECSEVTLREPQKPWPHGEIRGGTQAYLMDDFYLTFFHSSFPANISKKRAYVMGAYLFDKEPPFSIRYMTPNPLGDLLDYSYENESKIVFPSGMVIEENSIFVVWGKADKKIQVTQFNKKNLIQSMVGL